MIVLFGIIYFAFSSRSIYHFWIDRSNPPGSITSHKRFTSLKALRLSSGLTSLTICFKPEIVVYKFLVGWAQLDIFAYPRRVILHLRFLLTQVFGNPGQAHVDVQRVKILPTKFSRSTGEKLPTSQVAWRDSTHKYPASVAAPALPGMRMKNSLRG